jgi:hypothetical protein
MRENRLYGSEGGVAKAIPTPIPFLPSSVCTFAPAKHTPLPASFRCYGFGGGELTTRERGLASGSIPAPPPARGSGLRQPHISHRRKHASQIYVRRVRLCRDVYH